ncbi:UNKNOWN [Stylonychia lemnae]|uniref:Uncharacterized protein n=1 Tax=Stylonychia lemnae TaxID=5949 RepID=A0A078A8K1_STYLE|nr:UNKNOWN [Stylonychia lemnae]|eukprot:CDW78549.1 UNKNOWN [Stylonychia lemnae]
MVKLLPLILTLLSAFMINQTLGLDKGKFNKMESFKKQFQFDLEEDDTIVKDSQDSGVKKSDNKNKASDDNTVDFSGNHGGSNTVKTFKPYSCSIFDKCRTCSFKELQLMPECQDTGYRLIKRCIKRDQQTGEIQEDKYVNEGCELYSGSIQEYNSDQEASGGQYAEPGSEAYSVFKFMFLMIAFGVGVTTYLNRRKDRILHEIYSKISIVNRN